MVFLGFCVSCRENLLLVYTPASCYAVFCRFLETSHATKMKANWFVHLYLAPKNRVVYLLEAAVQLGMDSSPTSGPFCCVTVLLLRFSFHFLANLRWRMDLSGCVAVFLFLIWDYQSPFLCAVE